MSEISGNQDLLQTAIQLAQQGQKEAARSKLMQIIQTEPGNQVAWLWLVDTCDTDVERKAILSRAIKLNPKNTVLSQAFDRLSKMAVPANTSQSQPEKAKPPVEIPNRKPDILFAEEPDLDWLSVDDELENSEGVATISDEEFSQLSKAFFSKKGNDGNQFTEPSVPVPQGTEAEHVLAEEKKAKHSFFDFLKKESEESAASEKVSPEKVVESVPVIEQGSHDENKKARIKKEEKIQAIEDELKQAFVEAEGIEKVNRITKKVLPKFVKRLLIYLVLIILLIVMIFGGLFLVEQYKQRQGISGNLELTQPTATLTATPDEQELAIQMTQAVTETPVQFADLIANTETSNSSVGKAITIDTINELALSYEILTGKPILWRDDLREYIILDGSRVMVYEPGQAAMKAELISAEEQYFITGDYSADGAIFAAVSRSMTISVWRVSDGQLIQNMSIPTLRLEELADEIEDFPFESLHQVEISPDQRTLTYGYGGALMVWSLETGELLYSDESLTNEELVRQFQDGGNGNYTFSYSPNGKSLALGIQSHLKIIDLQDENKDFQFQVIDVSSIRFMNDQQLLVVERQKDQSPAQATIWNVETGEFLFRVSLDDSADESIDQQIEVKSLGSVLIGGDGKFYVEGQFGIEREIRIYGMGIGDMYTGIPLDTLRPLYGMAASPDGSLLVYWRLDRSNNLRGQGSVHFWDAEKMQDAGTCLACEFPFASEPRQSEVLFSTDGSRIAFCAEGYGCRVMQLQP